MIFCFFNINFQENFLASNFQQKPREKSCFSIKCSSFSFAKGHLNTCCCRNLFNSNLTLNLFFINTQKTTSLLLLFLFLLVQNRSFTANFLLKCNKWNIFPQCTQNFRNMSVPTLASRLKFPNKLSVSRSERV